MAGPVKGDGDCTELSITDIGTKGAQGAKTNEGKDVDYCWGR